MTGEKIRAASALLKWSAKRNSRGKRCWISDDSTTRKQRWPVCRVRADPFCNSQVPRREGCSVLRRWCDRRRAGSC